LKHLPFLFMYYDIFAQEAQSRDKVPDSEKSQQSRVK